MIFTQKLQKRMTIPLEFCSKFHKFQQFLLHVSWHIFRLNWPILAVNSQAIDLNFDVESSSMKYVRFLPHKW